MARVSKNGNFQPTLNAAQQWVGRCLIEDRSILSSAALWTLENITVVRKAFVDNLDEGEDDFSTKLERQMEHASSPAKRLMAEMLWALLLFPSNIKVSTKRKQTQRIWSLSGDESPESKELLGDKVLGGIGSGGQGFNNHRWRELVFLIELVADLKKRSSDERQSILSNYDSFMLWIDKIPTEGSRQFRHMLRYFCFPDRVERMSSNSERRAALAGFGIGTEKEMKGWTDRELDDALLDLRDSMQKAHPSEVLDFYEEPLKSRWRRPDDDVSFSTEDCEVFSRYPDSVSWKHVSKADQARFKEVRTKLKSLAQQLAAVPEAPIPLKAETSHYVPNGRSPKEIWCCVYPLATSNKSYGLQIALIISERGAEVCFCMGSGTSQVASEKRHELETGLDLVRKHLENVPQTLIVTVEKSQKRKWYYRKAWLAKPDESDFGTLTEWVRYASTPRSSGASISHYLTPTELKTLGTEIFNVFADALNTFGPLLRAAYSAQPKPPKTMSLLFDSSALSAVFQAMETTRICVENEFLNRLVFSLVAKPFLILTGNSGTGKTKLATLFVQWLCGGASNRYALVSVGADWTDNRNVVGFVNHLRSMKVKEAAAEIDLPIYQTTKILDLLLDASKEENQAIPFFLILDEMNLSHVERYFADFLSTMESRHGRLLLHREGRPLPRRVGGPCDVPETLALPENIFVIGTVNVDETTYMFSPKVLDRANVLEFLAGTDAALLFLKSGHEGIADIEAAPTGYAEGFLELSFRARNVNGMPLGLTVKPGIPPDDRKDGLEKCQTTIADLFSLMQKRHLEFAYRTMTEMLRYLAVSYELKSSGDEWKWKTAMDAQILQKILPKLHGSKRKIGSLLAALAKYCEQGNRTEAEPLLIDELKAETYLAAEDKRENAPAFKQSYIKLCKMIEAVRRDQFVSFIQ